VSAENVAVPRGDAQPARKSAPGDRLSICYVSADYPVPGTRALGGIGAHTYALAHAIAALGHRVSVITQSERAGRYRDGPVDVVMLAPPSLRLWKLGRVLPLPWLRRSYAVWLALKRLAHEQSIDVISFPDGYGEGFVHSFAPVAPSVVQLFGPATLVERWDGRAVPPALARSQSYIERRPAAHASICIAATRAFADEMATVWSLDRQRLRIVRNPLDLERFRPGHRAPGSERFVLFAGHLQRLKGVETLAEAIPAIVARHDDVRFVLVGNDTRSGPNGTSMRAHLESMFARSGVGDRVRLVDAIPQPELVSLYQSCALFVLPSHRDVYPNAVLEAMACGRPCVVTTGVGVAELVLECEGGAVVAPGDPPQLGDAISALLALPSADLKRLGANARRGVERACSRTDVARQTVDAYRSILDGRAVGSVAGGR
jgi:glycosyltransferase involved in cell wall biosynthesis